ncbi:unnamed protein product [Symbiodinium necroappetens]|uniref:Uncharacterized protein n=1 Tax=Symbiodinium necroappetens TaxID=1628268 RepID=A0A812YWW1_9DINO|nr:unnamed protein product [Symbiodinium necroappetens]
MQSGSLAWWPRSLLRRSSWPRSCSTSCRARARPGRRCCRMLAPSAGTAADIGAMRCSVSTQNVAIVRMGIVMIILLAATAVAHPLFAATAAAAGPVRRELSARSAITVLVDTRRRVATRETVKVSVNPRSVTLYDEIAACSEAAAVELYAL